MLKRAFKQRLRGAVADHRGVAAVEFALIAPLLILLYFGLSELASGITAARHANQSASSLGDLVAQCSNLNDSDAANILSAASDIMAPLPVTTLQLRVSSIIQQNASTSSTVVQWSKAPAGQSSVAAYTPGKAVTLPAGLTNNANDTVIVSEAVYQFTFPIDLFNGLLNFDDVAYFKPRKSLQVTYTGTGPGGTTSQTSCYTS
jgi:Flp pilus assembly protein TadG